VISLSEALPDMMECRVEYGTAKRISNGIRPSLNEIAADQSLDGYKGFIKVIHGPSLAAVMEIDLTLNDEEGWLRNIRVFA
jgi:hypothetical protein